MDDNCVDISLDTSRKSIKQEETLNNEKENDRTTASSPSSRSSPETNCPICLGKLENKSFTDSCLHQFCFTCLLEWAKVKAECPLCKQSFKSIIHNVRSIEDYEQYYLNNAATEGRLYGILARYEPTQSRESFRYRTTAVSSYLDYFVRLEEAISHHVIPTAPTNGLAPWRRRRQCGTSEFRRNIYQQGLWVQRTRDVTGRIRDCTPEFYRSNPALVHRLVPWLNRELNVLCNGNEPLVQHVMSRILDLITQVPIRSPCFNTAIAPYIGRHAEHFIHELYSFASSPFDLVAYDRNADYVDRISLAHDITSDHTDGNDSDVQIVGPYTPPIQLVSDSDSDECVVVESVVPPRAPPEVITLESDSEDVVQVNIHIGTGTANDINQPGPSKRPTLKRNWLTVNNVQVPTSSNDNVNVSINIARASRSQSSSEDTSSSSSWSPYSKKSFKTKNKKEKLKRKNVAKGKFLKCKNKSKVKQLSSNSNDDRSANSVLTHRRRRPSVLLTTSSDDDDDSHRLHIVTDQYSSTSSDELEHKPRLRSVVVKSAVKPELQTLSSEHSVSPSRSNNNRIENNLESKPHTSTTFNQDVPESSSTDWSDIYKPGCSYRRRSYTSSSSERLPYKKFKSSKKRSNRDKL